MLTIGIVAGVALVLVALQWRNVKRLVAAGNAQVSKLSRWVWRADPIAIYQAEVDKSAEEIQEASGGLEQFRGLVSRLQRDVAKGEKEVERLTQKVKNLLLEGNETKAADYAIDLRRVQVQLVKDKTKLEEHEAQYQINLKKIKYANQKIHDAKEKAERLKHDLSMSRVEAEASKLAQNFKIKTSSIDNLSELEDEIQRQIDTNRAKGQVIHDMGDDGLEELDDQEKEQKQEVRQLLDQMKQELLPSPKIEVKILPPIDQHERN